METFTYFFLPIIMVLIVGPLVTCVIETPLVVSKFKITKEKEYVICVNLMTNLVLNCVSTLITMMTLFDVYSSLFKCLYLLSMEFLIIPMTEAWLYKFVSKETMVRIIRVSYLANVISFIAGEIIMFAIRSFSGGVL